MADLRLIVNGACPHAMTLDGADRYILGPRYSLIEFQSRLVANTVSLIVVCRDADDDLIELDWDLTDVRALISALTSHAYRNSQWCITSLRFWVACDAYVLNFNLDSVCEDLNCPTYYLKFGFLPGVDHTSAIVSIHRGYKESVK